MNNKPYIAAILFICLGLCFFACDSSNKSILETDVSVGLEAEPSALVKPNTVYGVPYWPRYLRQFETEVKLDLSRVPMIYRVSLTNVFKSKLNYLNTEMASIGRSVRFNYVEGSFTVPADRRIEVRVDLTTGWSRGICETPFSNKEPAGPYVRSIALYPHDWGWNALNTYTDFGALTLHEFCHAIGLADAIDTEERGALFSHNGSEIDPSSIMNELNNHYLSQLDKDAIKHYLTEPSPPPASSDN